MDEVEPDALVEPDPPICCPEFVEEFSCDLGARCCFGDDEPAAEAPLVPLGP